MCRYWLIGKTRPRLIELFAHNKTHLQYKDIDKHSSCKALKSILYSLLGPVPKQANKEPICGVKPASGNWHRQPNYEHSQNVSSRRSDYSVVRIWSVNCTATPPSWQYFDSIDVGKGRRTRTCIQSFHPLSWVDLRKSQLSLCVEWDWRCCSVKAAVGKVKKRPD